LSAAQIAQFATEGFLLVEPHNIGVSFGRS
jgi:hypothetical protein